MYYGVAFDLDGTLVALKEIHKDCLDSALIKYHFPIISESDHINIFDGLPTKEKLRILEIPENKWSDIIREKQVLTLNYIRENIKEDQQITESLVLLKDLGYKTSLCSNATEETVDLTLEKMKITGYFDYVLGNSSVSRPKPSPRIYWKACSLMSLDPNRVVCVEDNEKGIKAAKEAGCFVWQVNGPEDITVENLKIVLEL